MSFLLDTNICSAHLKRPGGLAHRMIQYSGRLYTSQQHSGLPEHSRLDPARLADSMIQYSAAQRLNHRR